MRKILAQVLAQLTGCTKIRGRNDAKILTKFCPWLALDAPYTWLKFGARSDGIFLARAKNVAFRMPGSNNKHFLKHGVSLTLLLHSRPESNVIFCILRKLSESGLIL